MNNDDIRKKFEEIEKVPDYVLWDQNSMNYKELLFEGKKGVDLDWWMRAFNLFQSGYKSRDPEIKEKDKIVKEAMEAVDLMIIDRDAYHNENEKLREAQADGISKLYTANKIIERMRKEKEFSHILISFEGIDRSTKATLSGFYDESKSKDHQWIVKKFHVSIKKTLSMIFGDLKDNWRSK